MVKISSSTERQVNTPDNQRIIAKDRIRDFAQDVREQLTGGATPVEIAAWPNKAERARRFIAGTASDADKAALTAEVTARGLDETPEQLAENQLVKEGQYSTAVAMIDGLTRKGLAAIDAAPDDKISETLKAIQSEAEAALQQLQQKG